MGPGHGGGAAVNRLSWLAAEVKACGLYGAQVRAWAATRRSSWSGIAFRSTAPHGRRRDDWPCRGSVYFRGGVETAAFFRAFANALEDACGGRGVVDVVSDYGNTPPEVGVHDDAWTPSSLHDRCPAADLVARLAADGGPRLVAVRSWCRTVSAAAGPYHERYTKNAVLCVLGARQAELLAEAARRFAEM